MTSRQQDNWGSVVIDPAAEPPPTRGKRPCQPKAHRSGEVFLTESPVAVPCELCVVCVLYECLCMAWNWLTQKQKALHKNFWLEHKMWWCPGSNSSTGSVVALSMETYTFFTVLKPLMANAKLKCVSSCHLVPVSQRKYCTLVFVNNFLLSLMSATNATNPSRPKPILSAVLILVWLGTSVCGCCLWTVVVLGGGNKVPLVDLKAELISFQTNWHWFAQKLLYQGGGETRKAVFESRVYFKPN